MRDWTALKERLSELRLGPEQRRVARYLIEGRSTREIAALMELSCEQVKLRTLGITYLLGRLPPDDAAAAEIPRRPLPAPPKLGAAARLPDARGAADRPSGTPR